MNKTEKPLQQVRKWKEEVSKITSKMSTKEVLNYFRSIHDEFLPSLRGK